MRAQATTRNPMPGAVLAVALAALAALACLTISGHTTAHATTTPTCYVVVIPYEDGSWQGGPLVYTDTNGVTARYFTTDPDGWAAHMASLGWLPQVKIGNGPLTPCPLRLNAIS